jgi:hypothetical protein
VLPNRSFLNTIKPIFENIFFGLKGGRADFWVKKKLGTRSQKNIYIFVGLFIHRGTKKKGRRNSKLILSNDDTPYCTVQTAVQVHYKCTVCRGWNKQPFNCSKQSV